MHWAKHTLGLSPGVTCHTIQADVRVANLFRLGYHMYIYIYIVYQTQTQTSPSWMIHVVCECNQLHLNSQGVCVFVRMRICVHALFSSSWDSVLYVFWMGCSKVYCITFIHRLWHSESELAWQFENTVNFFFNESVRGACKDILFSVSVFFEYARFMLQEYA